MPNRGDNKPLTLCLIATHDVVSLAAKASCTGSHRIDVLKLSDIVDENNTLSEQGREAVRNATLYDLILLEWNMEQAPFFNTVCFQVRRTVNVPLVAICRGAPENQIAALSAGADDVLFFPIYPALLWAIKGAYNRLVDSVQSIERGRLSNTSKRATHVLKGGNLWLDKSSRKCYVSDIEMDLTFREFSLLEYFLEHIGKACSREDILDEVWGVHFDTGTNMVDVYVYYLRNKLSANRFEGRIETVRGFGYRLNLFEKPEEASDPEASAS